MISTIAKDVYSFHEVFQLPIHSMPTLTHADDELLELRSRLLLEEAQEFVEAAKSRDLVEMADALADVVYVAYGSAIALGIDLDAVLAEVHQSNMSKLDDDGKPIFRHDGKVIKSNNYVPPNIDIVLTNQIPLAPAIESC